jgi:DNA-binding NarL/FixJ family response regulator
MKHKIPKIIIADDHDMFRDALKTMLELDNIAIVLAEAANGKELLNLLEEYTPDIILLDIDMPLLNGIDAAGIINSKYPEIKILGLSMYGDEKYYKEMIESGAKGFILKSSNKSELEEAIKALHKGQSYFSNELLRKIIEQMGVTKNEPQLKAAKIKFTQREIDVLKLLCQGLSSNDIAEKLFLSAKTIENYRVKLLQKTNSKNSVGLVVFALKQDIIQL